MTSEEIITYIVTSGVPTIAIIIVGFILDRQVKSQKELIESQRDYINTTDWKKIKEYYEDFEIPSLLKKRDEIHSEFHKASDEMFKYLHAWLKNLESKEKGIAKRIVVKYMPTSELYFQDIWQNDSQRSLDNA